MKIYSNYNKNAYKYAPKESFKGLCVKLNIQRYLFVSNYEFVRKIIFFIN
jgi:hypothetical protein